MFIHGWRLCDGFRLKRWWNPCGCLYDTSLAWQALKSETPRTLFPVRGGARGGARPGAGPFCRDGRWTEAQYVGSAEILYFSGDSVSFSIDNQFIFRDSKITLMLVDIGTRDEVVL
jgi:hypothetical protein